MRALLEKFRNRRLVAVDFDSRQLRLVCAEYNAARAKVLKLVSVPMPDGMDMENAELLGEFFSKVLDEHGLKKLGVLMNVPRSQSVLKSLRLPADTSAEQLPAMVRYQVEGELPFPAAEAVIDFTIESHYDTDPDTELPEAENSGEMMSVLVAAVRLPVLEHYRQITRSMGVKLLRLGLRPYADHRCVQACSAVAPSESAAVVHLTADEAEIDVLSGGMLVFSRSVVVNAAGFSSSPDMVSSVTMEVARTLQSFQAMGRNVRVDRVLVAGSGGAEAQLAESIAARLGLESFRFDPALSLGLTADDDTSAFISALGLAVGHRGEAALPFDFLNPKRSPPRRDVKKIRRRLIAAGLVAAVVAVVAIGAVRLGTKRARQQALVAQFDKLVRKGGQDQRKVVRSALARDKALEKWISSGPDWLGHWAQISGLFPGAQRAYVASGFVTNADGSINMTIRARDMKTLELLGDRLNQAGYKFVPSRSPSKGDPFGYEASVDVKLRADGAKIDLDKAPGVPRPGDDGSFNALQRRARGSRRYGRRR